MVYDNVKARADEKHISIYELEKRANLSSGSIVKWKTRNPGSVTLYKVASILGCTMEELLREDSA